MANGSYQKIRAVMDADPATFAALSDDDAATEFNAEDKSFDLPSMSGKQVKDNIDSAEWAGRTDAQKQIVLALVARDDLDPHGIDATIFQDAMAGATNTLTALMAARTITTSTAFINGIATPVLKIHVANARALG